jgi:hypothetical protein
VSERVDGRNMLDVLDRRPLSVFATGMVFRLVMLVERSWRRVSIARRSVRRPW